MSISGLSASTFTYSTASRPTGSAAGDGKASGTSATECKGSSSTGSLTPEQQKQVTELKKRDSEVRHHEAAHLAAAGGFARGGPVFNYQTGPDGRSYAVGGHVNIDTSAIAGNPRATLAKAQQVQRAALAPADPSSQDQSVAAAASAQAAKALSEIAKSSTDNSKSDGATTRTNSNGQSRTAKAIQSYANTSASDESGGTVNVLG